MFDFYLHPAPSAALAVYEAPPDLARAFLAACQAAGVPALHLPLSALLPQPEPLPANILPLFEQDLPAAAFTPRAPALLAQLYPLWLANRPFCWFSRLPKTACASPLSGHSLHAGPAVLDAALAAEQLLALLERTGYEFLTPPADPFSPPEPPYPLPEPRPSQSLDPDSGLDPDQARAALHLRGPLRVLAPAGSGKTKTLINRVAHLVAQGAAPETILALAFNRKAMEEMKARLEAKGLANAQVYTFHALGYRLLRETHGWAYSSGSELALRRLLRQAAEQTYGPPAPPPAEDPFPLLVETTARARLELLPLEPLTIPWDGGSENPRPFAPIFHRLLEAQTRQGLIGFPDMVYLALRALLEDPALRRRWQGQFEYVLVDEFQDLNEAQMRFAQILALPENHLFVVGDDDQMIYGWRGATVRHVLDFPQKFPASGSVVLGTNYRSGRRIVQHAAWLIRHNPERVEKHVRARPGAARGLVEISLHPGLWAQARAAADWLTRQQALLGQPWEAFAVLYRYNALALPVSLALTARGIPHTALPLAAALHTPVTRDLLACLDVLLRPHEARPESFIRLAQRLTRARPPAVSTWEAFCNPASYRALPPQAQAHMEERIVRVQRLSAEAQEPGLSPAAYLARVGAQLSLRPRPPAHKPGGPDNTPEELLFDIHLAAAQTFTRLPAFLDYLQGNLGPGSDSQPPEETEPPEIHPGEVTLLTIHKAKGKEFDHVVYFDLSKPFNPGKQADVPEERRVTYVGLTRARHRLLVTASHDRPSPFLPELALDPGLAAYAPPYLERQKSLALREIPARRREIARKQKKAAALAAKLATAEPPKGIFARGLARRRARKLAALHAELRAAKAALRRARLRLDDLQTEIHFRKVLRID